MRNVTATANEKLLIKCYVTGYPIKSVSWYRGNKVKIERIEETFILRRFMYQQKKTVSFNFNVRGGIDMFKLFFSRTVLKKSKMDLFERNDDIENSMTSMRETVILNTGKPVLRTT